MRGLWQKMNDEAFKSGNRLLEMNTLRHIGARAHPTARFEIDSVEPLEDAPVTRVRVRGFMRFHGTTREIEADPTVTTEDGIVTISGDWTLRQSDFGLNPPRLAILKVDDDIEVEFRLVARMEET
ncbi:MAG: YceI family protein [Actinobacteria bacterium ATB1]|nr:YceI family protein [Actinobacteria bacterium ATB1]